MEGLWNSILELTSQFVIPDWAALIALLPVFLLIVIVVWLILLVRRFATAGPRRRGKARVTPVPPPGTHLPGPSLAPILAAIGAFLVFWGLVVGGGALWVGVAALAVTLLAWGREGLRDYDHLDEGQAPSVPMVVHGPPPPGVHMPGPSFRPLLAALGVGVLFFGLVFGGWLLAVGVLLTVVTLLGWLFDARREYVKVVEADATGHLENIPAPSWPRRLLWAGALLVAVALLVDNGIVPPRGGTAAGGEPPQGVPGPSSEPGAGGPATGGGPEPSGPSADVTIVAEGVTFTTPDVTAPGGDFTIAFDNRDTGTPHDVDVRDSDGQVVADIDVFPGPDVRVYEVSGIEPGSYQFFCSVHANMTGSLTVE